MKLERIKLIVALVIAAVTIIGTILAIDKYFAKTADVAIAVKAIEEEYKELEVTDELTQERLDIAITDDQIFQQEQHIQQMRNYHIFAQKLQIPEMTGMEKEAMKDAVERLENLEKVKTVKIKRYEEMKKGD